MTFQPERRSSRRTLASLARFLLNFRTQKALFVFGTDRPALHTCRCQKHPCTITAVPDAGTTTSGVPGIVFTFD